MRHLRLGQAGSAHTHAWVWNPLPLDTGFKAFSFRGSQYPVKFYVRSLNINHEIPAGSCPGWQMGRGSSLWGCRTACSSILVLRTCPISSLHRPFPVSFPCFYLLHLQVTQGEIFQLWIRLQSGILLSLRALHSSEQGRRGSRWVLEQVWCSCCLQWAQVPAGDEELGGRGCLSV